MRSLIAVADILSKLLTVAVSTSYLLPQLSSSLLIGIQICYTCSHRVAPSGPTINLRVSHGATTHQIHFPLNLLSVRIVLDEPEVGYTVVKLKQTSVPEEDRYGNSTVVENVERGWRDLIFNKIRAVFGFGI